MNINTVVIKETLKIAVGVLVLSLITLLIFVVLDKYEAAVALSLLIGSLIAIGNFFLMGIFLQKAINKKEDQVKSSVRLSYTYRMLVIFIILAVCLYSGYFNTIALLLPLIFPRVTIAIGTFFRKKESKDE